MKFTLRFASVTLFVGCILAINTPALATALEPNRQLTQRSYKARAEEILNDTPLIGMATPSRNCELVLIRLHRRPW
jgi:hypothetical protein